MKELANGLYLCPRCKLEVGIDEVYPRSDRPNSLRSYCKTCDVELQKGYSKVYNSSEKGIATRERYRATEKGRLAAGRSTQRVHASGKSGHFFSKYFN